MMLARGAIAIIEAVMIAVGMMAVGVLVTRTMLAAVIVVVVPVTRLRAGRESNGGEGEGGSKSERFQVHGVVHFQTRAPPNYSIRLSAYEHHSTR